MWEDGFCRGRVAELMWEDGFVEEELQSVWKIEMERIQSEKLSARCPFSCIIMEKGGYG